MKKYIKKVTVTGASDDTSISDMIEIQKRFPFVEWGILYSKSQQGRSNRFPSLHYISKLSHCQNHTINDKFPLNLSIHLCGSVVETILTQSFPAGLDLGWTPQEADTFGDLVFFVCYAPIQRIQINTHGERYKYNLNAIESYLIHAKPDIEFIAQYDNENDYIHELYAKGYKNISALYDLSHGAGVLPDKWEKPLEGIFTGYAGGLSPDNLEQELKKLDEVVTEPIWIDAETWLRTNDLFDLDKVVKFLEIASSRVI